MGLRRATPLFPLLGSLYSNWSSKSEYSFSVMSQPPPLPLTNRMPFSAPQTAMLPPSFTFQPVKSLPLKRASKPLGGSLSADSAAGAQQKAAASEKSDNQRRIIACLHRY